MKYGFTDQLSIPLDQKKASPSFPVSLIFTRFQILISKTNKNKRKIFVKIK